MARTITCLACGKDVEPGDYCSRCGASLDPDDQEAISREYSAQSERTHLAEQAERLAEYAESAGERDALARIKLRVENTPLEEFADGPLPDT